MVSVPPDQRPRAAAWWPVTTMIRNRRDDAIPPIVLPSFVDNTEIMPGSDRKPVKVMLAGVVPPPVHGQSLATQALFDADLSPVEKTLVPIRSSRTLASVGKFSVWKVVDLVLLVLRAWTSWLRDRPTALYYTAGSGAWVPFFRDLIFLACCRPLFKRTLIHYHSGNLVEFLEGSKFKSALGRFTYGRGAWTIRLGPFSPAPVYPGNRVFDVPNGIDAPPDLPVRQDSDSFRILFLGNLFEDKGVIDLIDAVHELASKHPAPITLSLIGGWPDDATRTKIEQRIAALPTNVTCPPPAPAYGDAKWQALASHDVFVFPSYYSSENVPLVIIEAMAASLPVIATDWRGIRSLVENGRTGFLVPVRDVVSLSESLGELAGNSELRHQLGGNARIHYQQNLTSAIHLDQIRLILMGAAEPTPPPQPVN